MRITPKKHSKTKARPTRFDALDAAENAFFGEQLEQIKAQEKPRKFRALRALEFVPLDPSIDPATEVLRVRSYSQVGTAKLIKSYADDLPAADVLSDEISVPFFSMGNMFSYSRAELRAQAKAGVPLTTKKVAAAKRAHEVLADRILASGDASTGLLGLLNQTNALTYTVPADGTGSTKTWSTKTPVQIIRDMVGICEYVVTQTNEVEMPNVLIIPREQYTLISTTRFDSNSDVTILDWFKKVRPGVAVEQWYKCDGAGAAGADRMVAYVLSPSHLEAALPMFFDQLPPQAKGLGFEVPCESRIGGVVCYYPLSMAYGDGI